MGNISLHAEGDLSQKQLVFVSCLCLLPALARSLCINAMFVCMFGCSIHWCWLVWHRQRCLCQRNKITTETPSRLCHFTDKLCANRRRICKEANKSRLPEAVSMEYIEYKQICRCDWKRIVHKMFTTRTRLACLQACACMFICMALLSKIFLQKKRFSFTAPNKKVVSKFCF